MDKLQLMVNECQQAKAPAGPLRVRTLVPFVMEDALQPIGRGAKTEKGSKNSRTGKTGKVVVETVTACPGPIDTSATTRQKRSKKSSNTVKSLPPTPPRTTHSRAHVARSPDRNNNGPRIHYVPYGIPFVPAGTALFKPNPANVPPPLELMNHRVNLAALAPAIAA